MSAAAQPAPAASAPASELAAGERAKRDGDDVYRWIKIHSDKPRKPVAPKEEKPAPVVRAKRTARAPEPQLPIKPPQTATAATPVVPAAEVPVTETPAAPAPAAPPIELAAPSQRVSQPVVTPAKVPEDSGVERLTPVSHTDPQFPSTLVRTLRKGQVQVRFTVQPDGSVTEPTVVSSSNGRLNAPALAAVAQWRFAPLRKAHSGVVDLGFNLD